MASELFRHASLASAFVIMIVTSVARADVFGLPPGQTSLEFVQVGNPGNAGEHINSPYYASYTFGGVSYTFNMGKYEVTAAQYTAFLNAVAATDTYGLYYSVMQFTYSGNITRSGSSGSYTYSVGPEYANRPIGNVTWAGAARFCNWLSNGQPRGLQDLNTTEDGAYFLNGSTSNDALANVPRKACSGGLAYYIPTEDEWYKAAYHKNDGATDHYWLYPTGTDSIPNNVLVNPDPGNSGNYNLGSRYTLPINNPTPYTNVGEFENSASPYGTFDQGGNVWEWMTSVEGNPGARGGGAGSAYRNMESENRHLSYLHANNLAHDLGFRVVQIPEPVSLTLLSFAGVGLLRNRRHRVP